MSFRRVMTVLFGVIFLAVGIFLSVNGTQEKKLQTAEAVAAVSDYVLEEQEVHSDSVEHRTYTETFYFPVFTFEANGREVSYKYSIGTGEAEYDIGTEIAIHYNPENPESFSVDGDRTDTLMSAVAMAVGAGTLLVGIFKRNL